MGLKPINKKQLFSSGESNLFALQHLQDLLDQNRKYAPENDFERGTLARGLQQSEMPDILVGSGIACLDGDMKPGRLAAFASATKAAVSVAEVAQIEARIRELEELLYVSQAKRP